MKTPIAVFGLGRSGVGIASAAIDRELPVHVYDQSDPEKLPKPELLEEVKALGVPVTLSWNGVFGEPPGTLVINPAVPSDHPAILAARSAGVDVIGEIEFAFQISRAPIVAITGTNGKSTTTVMTYLALLECGKDAVLCGNIFGSGYPEMSLTDAASKSTSSQILVAEVSSFQLEFAVNFHPIISGITNIWPDHLDRYENFAAYRDAKHRIFMNQTSDDYAIVRANDPEVTPPGQSRSAYVPRIRRRPSNPVSPSSSPSILTFGSTGQEARVEENELVILDQKISLSDLPFSEPHNYQNACMAALMAYGTLRHLQETPSGKLPACAIEGLKKFRGLAHRMELVGVKNGIRVINNSMCTNPDAVIKSVQAVKDPTHILLGGTNKKLDFGPLRHYLANHRHTAYVYGRDAAQLSQMLGGNMLQFATMQEAFQAAVNNAKTNQVVMLAPGCASMDSFRDFRDRGDVFRSLATDWLKQ